jgi:hypothetical protein
MTSGSTDFSVTRDDIIKRALRLIGVLAQAGLVYTQTEKGLSDSEKDRIKWLTELNEAYKEYLGNEYKYGEKVASTLNSMNAGSPKNMRFGTSNQMSSLLGRGIDTSKYKEMEADYKKRQELEKELISGTASILRSEFGSAWEDIFGEANSLFEKMIASWAETFFAKFSGDVLAGLLPGGGFLSDLFGTSRSVTQAQKIASAYRVGE